MDLCPQDATGFDHYQRSTHAVSGDIGDHHIDPRFSPPEKIVIVATYMGGRNAAAGEANTRQLRRRSWLELAQLNSISYPYTIYPGQVLQLPAGKPTEPEPARVVVPGKAVETTVYVPLVFKNYASHKVTPADIITSLVSRFGGVPAKLRNP